MYVQGNDNNMGICALTWYVFSYQICTLKKKKNLNKLCTKVTKFKGREEVRLEQATQNYAAL